MRFIITIDTEGDNQWDHGRDLTVENIKFVPRFQDLCDKYLIKPTYLVTSEICKDEFAKKVFSNYLKNDKAEIGAHLHSWTTPPFLDKQGYRENDANHAFASELPLSLLSKKIENLTGQIENTFGRRPTSFRSGRYGLNKNVVRELIRNSYLVDSSVTPFVNWSAQKGAPDGTGGPDFISSSPFPHKFEFSDGMITEIPITILPTRFPINKSKKLATFYFTKVNRYFALRAVRKFFLEKQPVWLRPTPEMNKSLLTELLNETSRLRLPFITMMFHSSELMPGCSKYRPDKASVEELYVLLKGFFDLLAERKIGSVTLTEAAKLSDI
jgi:hypothetical protein